MLVDWLGLFSAAIDGMDLVISESKGCILDEA